MEAITFNTKDAELLFCFPKPPADIKMIVWNYTFINRAAPPSWGELTSCLTKGLRVGIIRQEGERFVIDDDWYGRIHKADSTAENEIESMLEFEEWFVGVDFDATTDDACVLTEGEF